MWTNTQRKTHKLVRHAICELIIAMGYIWCWRHRQLTTPYPAIVTTTNTTNSTVIDAALSSSLINQQPFDQFSAYIITSNFKMFFYNSIFGQTTYCYCYCWCRTNTLLMYNYLSFSFCFWRANFKWWLLINKWAKGKWSHCVRSTIISNIKIFQTNTRHAYITHTHTHTQSSIIPNDQNTDQQ